MISSVVTCIIQALIYPWIVNTLNVPIPYLATIGCFIVFICFILMSAASTEMGSMIASLILWIGFCCAAPSSVSIISVHTGYVIFIRLLLLKTFKVQYYHGITSVIKHLSSFVL